MNRRRIALDTAIVLGLSFVMLGFSVFYSMFLGPGHGDFAICGQGVATSCWVDSSGPIAMGLMLVGGAISFCVGAFCRKTSKMTLWEGVLLGYVLSLFFALVVLPEGAFPLLPLNGGGILIFALSVMSLVGIVISAFKYIQTSNGGTPKVTKLKLPLLASPKRRRVYILIFIVGLILAVSLFDWPSIVYGGGFNYGCPIDIGELSFQISNYSQLVGPPLFAQEQFVLAPGSTTYVTYVWNATTSGNNVMVWFTQPPDPNRFNYTPLWRINPTTGQFDGVPTTQNGVTDIFQNITFQGNHIAKILYKISLSPLPTPATYELTSSCDYHLLMTVGSLPYWGPLFYGEVQPMELLFNLAISIIGSSLLITILQIHYTDEKKR